MGFTPGDKVVADAHDHSFGACFLVGEGVVLENRDVISVERGDVRVRLSDDLVAIFNEKHIKSGILHSA